MSEARPSYGKRKAKKAPASRKDAVKDALPDIQPPVRKRKFRGPEEVVAESDEDDD